MTKYVDLDQLTFTLFADPCNVKKCKRGETCVLDEGSPLCVCQPCDEQTEQQFQVRFVCLQVSLLYVCCAASLTTRLSPLILKFILCMSTFYHWSASQTIYGLPVSPVSFCLPVILSVGQPVILSLGLSASLSFGLSAILSFGQSAILSLGLSFSLSASLSIGLYASLSFGLSANLSFGLSASLSFGLSASLSFGLPTSLFLGLSAILSLDQ